MPARYRARQGEAPIEQWRELLDAEIHLDRWHAEGSPLLVYAIHGGGSYGRGLAPFARIVSRAGFETIAPDLPGYGLTQAPPDLVDYSRWADVVTALVQNEYKTDKRPIVLAGFSLASIFSFEPSVEPEDFRACPILLTHPEDDRWLTVESSRLFFDRIAAPKELVLLNNCGHFPTEEPGIDQMADAIEDFLHSRSGDYRIP